MQSPSSLIFLVLLGVWAAYFVQHWVRRRDHIATARSVEQFSEAMRVLERRDPLPRTDLSEQAPRSYAVHPARANRPQVLVKRAVPAERTAPLTVMARVTDREGGTTASASTSGATSTAAAGRRRESSPTSSNPSAVGPGRPGSTAAVRPRLRPSRRVRGLLVLAALAELLLIMPLVALSMLSGWALATGVIAVIGAFAFLRAGVRTEQRMMRAHRRRQADLARLRSAAPATPDTTRRPAPRRVAAGSTVATASAGSTTGSAGSGASTPVTTPAPDAVDTPTTTTPSPPAEPAASSPLDVALEVAPATEPKGQVVESEVVPASAHQPPAAAPSSVAAEAMVPILDEDDMPLTWDPVPVPRPTYTMKARAERREVAPAAVTPDAAPAVRADEADDAAYERRVAGA